MWLEKENRAPAGPRARSTVNLLATFEFGGRLEHTSFPCLSRTQQAKFEKDFWEQLEELAAALATHRDRDGNAWLSPDALLPPRLSSGLYQPRSDFHVFVSEAHRIARALVPAWQAQRGWMEFPAHRVVAGEAALAHELVHVLLPNGNRMLAEGLATYLQCKLFPSERVFPNFGRPLEALLADFLRARYPDPSQALWMMDLDALERISTPDRMSLRIGGNVVGSRSIDQPPPPEEEKALYAVVGSLVELLMENPIGDDLLTEANFVTLYNATPLRPLERDSGDPGRWQICYQGDGKSYSFGELGLLWKTYLHFMLFRRPLAGADEGMPIPEEFAHIPLVARLYDRLHAMVGLRPLPAIRAKQPRKIKSGQGRTEPAHAPRTRSKPRLRPRLRPAT